MNVITLKMYIKGDMSFYQFLIIHFQLRRCYTEVKDLPKLSLKCFPLHHNLHLVMCSYSTVMVSERSSLANLKLTTG